MNTRKLITLIVFALAFLLTVAACAPKRILPQGATTQQAANFEALYKFQMPWQYEQWKQSTHGKAGVTCINCHDPGPDGKIKPENLDTLAFGGVQPGRCGKCHEKGIRRLVADAPLGSGQARHRQCGATSCSTAFRRCSAGMPVMPFSKLGRRASRATRALVPSRPRRPGP